MPAPVTRAGGGYAFTAGDGSSGTLAPGWPLAPSVATRSLISTIGAPAKVLTWSGEGGTNATGITTGNSGGTSGIAFDAVTLGTSCTATYDNTHSRGSLAAKLSTGATSADCSLEYVAKVGAQTRVYFRGYFYITSNPTSNHRLIDAWDSGSGQLCFAIFLTTAGKLQATDTAGGQIAITTASIPLNAWFRVEGFASGSATAGQVQIQLFSSDPDATTPDETVISAATVNTRGSFNNYRFGSSGAPMQANRTIWVDDLGLSTGSYLGPTGGGTALSIDGAGDSTSSATGDFTATLALSGTAASVSTATGALTQTMVFAGTAVSTSSATGTVSATLVLSGAAAASTSSASGALARVTPITGAAASTSAATGALVLIGALAGTASSTSSAAGALTRVTPIAGVAASTSSAAGDVTITSGPATLSIAGTAASTSSATAAVTTRGALTGTAASTSAATGALTQRMAIAGTASSASAATGALTLRASIAGVAASASSASGLLGLRQLITGTGSSISAALGALSIVGPVAPITLRPFTGTTARPSTGTTSRPGSGTTARPGSGITVRPYTGTTVRP